MDYNLTTEITIEKEKGKIRIICYNVPLKDLKELSKKFKLKLHGSGKIKWIEFSLEKLEEVTFFKETIE